VDAGVDAPRALAWGVPRRELDSLFEDVREVGRIRHDLAMERDVPVHLCERPRRPLSEIWLDQRRLGSGLRRLDDAP
jgi:hypothetical protein